MAGAYNNMDDFKDHFKVEQEDVDKFKRRLFRTKTIKSQSSIEEDEPEGTAHLEKILETSDLISLGVGSCVGTGMYVVAGLVAKNVAGPAAIFSFIISALASILSGVCYGEFGVRVPKTSGSAYMYSYVTVGEFVAFLIGWNLILEYMIGSAAGASAISACFDALGNHSMSAYLEANVGTVIGKAYPDFLGFFIGLGMTVVLAMGVQKSVRFNNILNIVNFIVWIFIIIAGCFYANSDNWHNYGGFSPYGASGVFSGAATCFYAFIGFDIIATTGEEAKNPSRSIPVAIVVSLVICLTAYVSVTFILTLMVPYNEIHGDSALIDMFVQNGASGAKWVVAIGALSSLTVSLLGSMFPMPRVVYAMSRDGLLFKFLSTISPRTNTPLIATLITGMLSSFMSLFVSLGVLVEMMSIGTLLAYTLVSVSVMILRYQPDLHESPIPLANRLDPIEESPFTSPDSENMPNFSKHHQQPPLQQQQKVGETSLILDQQQPVKLKDAENLITPTSEEPKTYGSLPGNLPASLQGAIKGTPVEGGLAFLARHGKIWWIRLGFPSDEMMPTDSTARWTIIYTGLLAISQTCTCLLIVFGADFLSSGVAWAVILLIVFLIAVTICFCGILRQPQNKKKIAFMAPAVPFLPSTAMFVNIYLMLKLPGLTWARLAIWICVGMLLYFGYSMMHSRKELKQQIKDAQQKTTVKAVGIIPNNDISKEPPPNDVTQTDVVKTNPFQENYNATPPYQVENRNPFGNPSNPFDTPPNNPFGNPNNPFGNPFNPFINPNNPFNDLQPQILEVSNTDAAWQTQHTPSEVRQRQAQPPGNTWDQENRPPPPYKRPLERKDSKPGPPRPPLPKQLSREGSSTTPPSGRSFEREDVPLEDRHTREARQAEARERVREWADQTASAMRLDGEPSRDRREPPRPSGGDSRYRGSTWQNPFHEGGGY